MERRSTAVLAISAAAVLCAFVAFFASRGAVHLERATPHRAASVAPAPGQPGAPTDAPLPSPTFGARATPSAAVREPGLDEPTLMQTLRELRGSDPSRTLLLAREGNARFQDSADSAERHWFVVKSLSDLGRHVEARTEGRVLVEKHRQTRWAEDVYRHLFVNPPTHPFEGGYIEALDFGP